MAQEWNEKAVYLAALELKPSDRESFLRGACPDESCAERIRSLLRHTEETGGLLDRDELKQPSSETRSPTIDEFRIVKMLGQGGMGTVYLANDTVLDRQVALKVIARHLTHSPRALERFTTEARVAARLKHPGIVPVFRFGFDGTDHYLVTEYVDGPTLADEIATRRSAGLHSTRTEDLRRQQRQAIEWIANLAEALDHAHRNGVTHRDVKPSNILIDPNVGPRLADFGIALQAEAEATTQSHEILGSCYYMSPEQAATSAGAIDHRSDIFSLGVVLYELLTLRRPFEGDDVNSVLRAVETKDPPRPRKLNRRISRDLEVVMLKCLEKRPIDRYQSAAHLAADLRAVLSDHPILARPPGPLRRMVRLAKRHRLATVGILFLVILFVIGGVALRQLQRERALDATVSFEFIDSSSHPVLSVQRREEDSPEYGPIVSMGALSEGAVRLKPGVYRFLIHDGETRSIDFEDVLLTSSHKQFRIDWGSTAADPPGMVLFDPDQLDPAQRAAFKDPITGAKTTDLPLTGPFWLDEAEVTNAEYREFVEATNAPTPFYWQNFDPAEIANLPVVALNRAQMLAYALWRGKRLPTAYEWLFAAQFPGGSGQVHPWGSDSRILELAIPSTAALTAQQQIDVQKILDAYRTFCDDASSHREFRTPAGLFHMFGNVHEMTSTVVTKQSGTLSVIAGGSWATDPRSSSCMDVGTYRLDTGAPNIGFRCARSADSH